jgi:uncharacterized protein
MSPKPWYAKGLRFECTRSGNCCRNHGDYAFVYLVERDVVAIAQFLEIEEESFLRRFCRKDDGWTVLRMDQPACPFQGESGACEIYPVRPRQCATWPFWVENLKEEVWMGPVRECCPGVGKGRLYSAREVEKIARETERWYLED